MGMGSREEQGNYTIYGGGHRDSWGGKESPAMGRCLGPTCTSCTRAQHLRDTPMALNKPAAGWVGSLSTIQQQECAATPIVVNKVGPGCRLTIA